MSSTLPLEDLATGGLNAPRTQVDDIYKFLPTTQEGASQYRYDYDNGAHLDALLLNKNSPVLVVSFHGALNREIITLPRYERVNTLLEYDVNALFFSDPGLWLDDSMQLSWFTGWKDENVLAQCAHWIIKTAQMLNVSRVIISGSSGGGFAALQVASLVPGSIALPFNPQTHIANYLVDNNPQGYGPVRKYVQVIHPECAVDGLEKITPESGWDEPLGKSVSALRSYSDPVQNFILFCHSPADWHYESHYLPFLIAAAKGDNLQRMRVYEYTDKPGHNPPQLPEFKRALDVALDWRLPRYY